MPNMKSLSLTVKKTVMVSVKFVLPQNYIVKVTE